MRLVSVSAGQRVVEMGVPHGAVRGARRRAPGRGSHAPRGNEVKCTEAPAFSSACSEMLTTSYQRDQVALFLVFKTGLKSLTNVGAFDIIETGT